LVNRQTNKHVKTWLSFGMNSDTIKFYGSILVETFSKDTFFQILV
jgi:hypothetical protein